MPLRLSKTRVLHVAFCGLAVAAVTAQVEPERRPFVRVVERADGGQLDVLIATYTKGDATLVLHGALHVADPEHYRELQQRFAAFDALLYELIADADLRPHPEMDLDSGDVFSVLVSGFGRGLGLVEQMGHVDYRAPNFVHADLTNEQWQGALEKTGSNELFELIGSAGATDPDREAEAKLGKQDFVAAARRGTSTHELRLAFARLLSEPEGTRRFPSVIIEQRNERCLDVLQQQLAAGNKKLGIYYGAAHMEHMERRLLQDLGWQRTGEEWLMAWDNRRERFPVVEKGTQQKRYRARKDVDALTGALGAWSKEYPGRTPTWDALRTAQPGGKLPGRADGVDPWGRMYELRTLSDGCEVRCAGPDGAVDTEDDLAGDNVRTVKASFFELLFGYLDRRREFERRLEAARREQVEEARRLGEQMRVDFAAAKLRFDAALFEAEHGRKPALADLSVEGRKDPWGNALRVVVTASGALEVRSDGPDGKPDTADDVVAK